MRIKKMLANFETNNKLPIVIVPEEVDVEKGKGWPPKQMILIRNNKTYETMHKIINHVKGTPDEPAVIQTGL